MEQVKAYTLDKGAKVGYMGQSLRCNETIAENFIYKLKKSQVEYIIYMEYILYVECIWEGRRERLAFIKS